MFYSITIWIDISYYTYKTLLIAAIPHLALNIGIVSLMVDWLRILYCGLIFAYMFINGIHHINRTVYQGMKEKFSNLNKTIYRFLSQHNELCQTLYLYNMFWSKLYLIILLTIIPSNLLWIYQFFYEHLDLEVYILIGCTVIIWTSGVFGVQYCFAYLSKKIHSPYKPLARIQWRMNGWSIRLATKLKLMAYIERLGSHKKIGLTVGPTDVLTLPLLFVVGFSFLNCFVNLF